ncbi:MAG: response regulator [Deltaproteobacteria bacterium]|nr:response regulator [Deltaproteobacteria bacterium]
MNINFVDFALLEKASAAFLAAAIAALGLLTMFDLAGILKNMRSAASGRHQMRRYAKQRFTTLGRALQSALDSLLLKLQAMDWQVHEAQLCSTHSERDPYSLIGSEIKSGNMNRDAFFNEVLTLISHRSRADAAIIMVNAAAGGIGGFQAYYKILSGRIPDSVRIREILRLTATSLMQQPAGLYDCEHDRARLGDIALFGLRYIVTQPFKLAAEEGDGFIALAYSSAAPSHAEITALRQLSVRVEKDLRDTLRIFELSGRVNEASRRDKERNDFLAHVSHDIRSPLNNISAIIHLFLSETAEDGKQHLLKAALGNCAQVTEIVEDLLDFSRHQAGRLEARVEKVSLDQCIDEVVEMHSVSAGLKGLSLTRELSKEGETYVLADRRHLKRVLNNLVSNAIKYTQKGWVKISVDTDGRSAHLRITDSGLGLSKEQLDILFTPFTRFHKGLCEGVGIGLSLSKVLLELNGGTIRVDSQLGRGSRFTAVLPLAVSAANIITSSMPKETAPQRSRTSSTILIVDDDPDSVESLAKNLARDGYQLQRCYSTSQALSCLRAESIDFVLSDINMPGGGGLKIVEALKIARREIPVLLLSGQELSDLTVERLPEWVKLLQKPYEYKEVQKWIEEMASINSHLTVRQALVA